MFLKLREILSIEMNLPAFSLQYESAGFSHGGEASGIPVLIAGFSAGIPGISPGYILPLRRAGTAGLVRGAPPMAFLRFRTSYQSELMPMEYHFARRMRCIPPSFLGELFRVSSQPGVISFVGRGSREQM